MNANDLSQQLVNFARCTLQLPPEIPLHLTPLTKGGSDRTYYRLAWSAESETENTMDRDRTDRVIAMHYNPERRENTLYADIAAFMQDLGVAVPAVFAHDPDVCFLVMEDLGSEDLWSYRKEPWTIRRDHYRETLTQAHRLHRYFRADNDGIGLPALMEGYDAALYSWEQQYFREEFVESVCGLSLPSTGGKALDEELSALAKRLMESGIGLVHRDLQSQNVMIHEKSPVLIDFQGLRVGSPFYDLGSLLYDPYVDLTPEEQLELLEFYYALSPQELNWPDFVTLFYEGSAQRLMQALGAYGFLGHRNGRADFRAHIPAGLRHLLDATSHISSLPNLKELTIRCLGTLKL